MLRRRTNSCLKLWSFRQFWRGGWGGRGARKSVNRKLPGFLPPPHTLVYILQMHQLFTWTPWILCPINSSQNICKYVKTYENVKSCKICLNMCKSTNFLQKFILFTSFLPVPRPPPPHVFLNLKFTYLSPPCSKINCAK